MDTSITEGTYIKWEQLNGVKHQGAVKEMDSNLAIVNCEIHQRECLCDNC